MDPAEQRAGILEGMADSAVTLRGQGDPEASYGAAQATGEDAVELKDVVEGIGLRMYHVGLFFLTWVIQLAPAAIIMSIPFVLRPIREEYRVNKTTVATIGGATMVGSIFGVLLFGLLNDWAGRRRAGLVAALGMGVLVALHFALPRAQPGVDPAWGDFALLVALRVVIGVFFAGAAGSFAQLLFSEFLPSRLRGALLTWANAGWSLGTIYMIFVAWTFEGQWRLILAAPALGALLGFVVLILGPESARWLFVVGRGEEGREVLGRVLASRELLAHSGDMPALGAVPRKVVVAQGDQTSRNHAKAGLLADLKELFGPSLYRVTLCSIILQSAVNGGSYIQLVWFPEMVQELMRLPRMPYQLFIYGEFAGWAGVAITSYLLDAWGRRPVLNLLLCVSACLILSFTIVPQEFVWLAAIYLMLQSVNGGLWPAMLTYVVECFPTNIRGTGNSLCQFCGRLSAVALPVLFGWVLDSEAHGLPPLPTALVLTSVIYVIGLVGALLIPWETANAKMEDI